MTIFEQTNTRRPANISDKKFELLSRESSGINFLIAKCAREPPVNHPTKPLPLLLLLLPQAKRFASLLIFELMVWVDE